MTAEKVLLLLLLLPCWICKTSSTKSSPQLANVLFASKTSYERSRQLFKEFARHTEILSSVDSANEENGISYPDNCVPQQLSLILRHGSRYASSGNVQRITKLIEKIQTLDINERYSGLKKWQNLFTADNKLTLAANGVQENVDIARRYVDLFPKLFQEAVNSESIEIHSSHTQRCMASAMAFSKGLIDRLNLSIEDFGVTQRDDLLRFYDHCHRYAHRTEEEKKMALAEYHKFMSGPELQGAARTVSTRLSSSGDSSIISVEEMQMMWGVCALETALYQHKHPSPWCDLITLDESQVLEYAADLKAYWKESYGYSLNYEQSCPLLSDVVGNMFELEKDASAPKLSFYFGHSEGLNSILALLGLFYDEQPLLASNYELHRENRKFRQSAMGSFASNLGFVKYSCTEGTQSTHPTWPSKLDSSMIQLIFNEHPIPFPFTNEMAVSFFDFETQYYQQIHHCNFEQLCNSPGDGTARDEL